MNFEFSLTLDGFALDPLPMKTPFSRSAWIHGPLPVHGGTPHQVEMISASMCALPVSVALVSMLPKSKQQWSVASVPLATSYTDSGCPLTATPGAGVFGVDGT